MTERRIKDSKSKAKKMLKRTHGRESQAEYSPIGNDTTSQEEIAKFNERMNK